MLTAELLAPAALWGYLGAVAEYLGVGIESVTVDLDPPASAYVALDGGAPGHMDGELALLWDERHGWAAAVETGAGDEVNVLGYLGGVHAVADPAEVKRFVDAVRSGWRPTMRPPEFAPTNDLDEYLTRET
ncbi:DUF6292 family protein [Labedaea rhizosphaerae]|uniref:DUF6292 domain-containing protein n=1 Tax=Labedaea rhizosphaerae TaxID=598644 RepID=A0A4R6SD13_LABRH|nr:DUF6292 family protein [Labedaea rhizosphaerae]TDP97821.1 hypothetical protein EV186_103798 [Labedaea rhizosphaerae]